jgi:hypothetical protein
MNLEIMKAAAKQPEALRLAEWLDHHGEKYSDAAAADTLRRQHALLVRAREWITMNDQHNDKCDVFCLDDDGRHLTCSCGLSSIIDSLNAELEK